MGAPARGEPGIGGRLRGAQAKVPSRTKDRNYGALNRITVTVRSIGILPWQARRCGSRAPARNGPCGHGRGCGVGVRGGLNALAGLTPSHGKTQAEP